MPGALKRQLFTQFAMAATNTSPAIITPTRLLARAKAAAIWYEYGSTRLCHELKILADEKRYLWQTKMAIIIAADTKSTTIHIA